MCRKNHIETFSLADAWLRYPGPPVVLKCFNMVPQVGVEPTKFGF